MSNKTLNFATDILPNTNSTYDLGNVSKAWANLYVDAINGNSITGFALATDAEVTTMMNELFGESN